MGGSGRELGIAVHPVLVLLILISFLLLVPSLHRPVIADVFKRVGMTAWAKGYSAMWMFNCVHSCSVKYSGKQFLQHFSSFKVWPSDPLQPAWTAVTALPVGHCVCSKAMLSCPTHSICNSISPFFTFPSLHLRHFPTAPKSCSVLIMMPAWEAETWHGQRVSGQALCFSHLVTPSQGGCDSICHFLCVGWKKEKPPA